MTAVLLRSLLIAMLSTMTAPAALATGQPATVFPQKLWKYHMPAKAKPFGDYDVISLAYGKRVHTDCSTIWLANSGTYCFVNQASLHLFLTDPDVYGERAQAFLNRAKNGDSHTQR